MNSRILFPLCIILLGMPNLSAMDDANHNALLNAIYRKFSFHHLEFIDENIPLDQNKKDQIIARVWSTTSDKKRHLAISSPGNQHVLICDTQTDAIIHKIPVPRLADKASEHPLIQNMDSTTHFTMDSTTHFTSAHFSPDDTMIITTLLETSDKKTMKHIFVWDACNAKKLMRYTHDGAPLNAYFNNSNIITLDELLEVSIFRISFIPPLPSPHFTHVNDTQKQLLISLDTQQERGYEPVYLYHIPGSTQKLRNTLRTFTPEEQEIIIDTFRIQDVKPSRWEKIRDIITCKWYLQKK